MIKPSNYSAWRGRVPNYYSWEDEDLKLRVKVRDQNKWKSIFHNYTYYYVGDIVKLVVYIEKLNIDSPDFSRIRIAEKVPSSKEYVPRKIGPGKADFISVVFAIRGQVLDESGDDIWRLEVCEGELVKLSRKIFDAGVVNKDSRRRELNSIIIGAIIALITGFILWFLGFIQIIPFWKVWIK